MTICLPRGEPDLAQRQQVVARRARSDVYNQLTRDRRRLLELTLENLSLKDRVAQASVDAAVALEERRTLEGAMEEALQSFASEAYLVDTRGIHPMNEEGRRALTNDTQDLDLAIMRSISQGGGDGFDVVRLGPNRWWVLRHHIDDELDRRLILARDLWRLTARQTEVLGELARGHANKEIAATLGCSVRTVEIHVGALLDRSGHDSRLALAAALWGLPRTVTPAPRRGSHV